ncbi:MAG: D-2-hydroxyacid dehydrogenase [Puniceicoccaceae bacterium]
MRKLVALDSETLDLQQDEWSALEQFGELVQYPYTPYEEAIILERCQGAEVVLSNKVPLMESTLSQLPELKLVCILATGTNNVDLAAAERLGIAVKNVPAYSTQAVAQHTLALVLELTNRVGHYSQTVHAGDWVKNRQFCYWDHQIPELAGRTIGMIGFGQIGRATAKVFNALGMRVIANVRTPKDAPDWDGFEFVTREEVFEQADIISLHCPQTAENTGFVNKEILNRCKPGAILINTARGPLINEQDLADALESGQLAGAAIDVLTSEPMAADCPLLGAPNCVITPHHAWASVEARKRLMQVTFKNIQSTFNKE